MGPKLSPYDIRDIKFKYKNTSMTLQEIASEYNVSKQAIHQLIERSDIQKRKRIDSYEDEIRKMYCEKLMTIKDIAKELNFNPITIKRFIDKNDIKRPTSFHKGNKFIYNETLFNKIDNEKEAYIFGYLFSLMNRGFRTAPVIQLSPKYREYGFQIMKQLIVNLDDKDVPREEYLRISVSSPSFSNLLKKYDLYDTRILERVFPDIQENMYRHFIRGFADSRVFLVEKPRNAFTINYNSRPFMTKLLDIFEREVGVNFKIIQLSDCLSIKTSNQKNLKNIFNYLYKDVTIYNEDNYNLFKSFIELQEEE